MAFMFAQLISLWFNDVLPVFLMRVRVQHSNLIFSSSNIHLTRGSLQIFLHSYKILLELLRKIFSHCDLQTAAVTSVYKWQLNTTSPH